MVLFAVVVVALDNLDIPSEVVVVVDRYCVATAISSQIWESGLGPHHRFRRPPQQILVLFAQSHVRAKAF